MLEKLTETQQNLLDLLGYALFDKKFDLKKIEYNWQELQKEALEQTVYTTIYPVIKDILPNELQREWMLLNARFVSRNIKVNYEHTELHRLMTDNNIPYTTIKGYRSASYYDSPIKRTMGDVDFLVREADVEKTGRLLESVGFVQSEDIHHHFHYGYSRDNSYWELHFSLGGIPDNEIGDAIKARLEDIIAQAQKVNKDNIECMVPTDYYHCVIMLLHLIEHLTNGSGIGLRHICDWAVFADKVDITRFQSDLKELGLWTFACQLTALSSAYLGLKAFGWCPEFPDDFLDFFIRDIIDGGNHGQKNRNRSGGINMVKESNVVLSLSARTKYYYPFFKTHKYLLPFGMIAYMCHFFFFFLTGERKWITSDVIKEAKDRKKLYEQFELFQ